MQRVYMMQCIQSSIIKFQLLNVSWFLSAVGASGCCHANETKKKIIKSQTNYEICVYDLTSNVNVFFILVLVVVVGAKLRSTYMSNVEQFDFICVFMEWLFTGFRPFEMNPKTVVQSSPTKQINRPLFSDWVRLKWFDMGYLAPDAFISWQLPSIYA